METITQAFGKQGFAYQKLWFGVFPLDSRHHPASCGFIDDVYHGFCWVPRSSSGRGAFLTPQIGDDRFELLFHDERLHGFRDGFENRHYYGIAKLFIGPGI